MPETGGLFVIDGEDAGTTPWEFDSVNTEGSNTFVLNADALNHGSYGYKLQWDGINNKCNGIKAFSSARDEVYVRTYFNIESGITVPNQFNSVCVVILRDGATDIISFRITRIAAGTNGVVDNWQVTGQELSTVRTITNFSLGAWHYVEIHWKKGTGADGGAQVWVDGDSIFSEFDNDLTAYALDDTVLGSIDNHIPSAKYFYYDDCKADTSPIGAYSEGGSMVPIILQQNRRRRS